MREYRRLFKIRADHQRRASWFWMTIVTGLVAVALISSQSALDQVRKTSKTSIDQVRRANAASINRVRESSALSVANLFHAQQNGCRRLNSKQRAVNKNSYDQWRFDSLFASAISKPQQPVRPETAQQRAARLKILHEFRNRLNDELSTIVWTPLNRDCVNHPTTTQLPVSFASRVPKAGMKGDR